VHKGSLQTESALIRQPAQGINNVAKQSLAMSCLLKNASPRVDVDCLNDCLASSFYKTAEGLTISISTFLKQSQLIYTWFFLTSQTMMQFLFGLYSFQ
jgi:hypothetical protein